MLLELLMYHCSFVARWLELASAKLALRRRFQMDARINEALRHLAEQELAVRSSPGAEGPAAHARQPGWARDGIPTPFT